jgi:hypothetical protein
MNTGSMAAKSKPDILVTGTGGGGRSGGQQAITANEIHIPAYRPVNRS